MLSYLRRHLGCPRATANVRSDNFPVPPSRNGRRGRCLPGEQRALGGNVSFGSFDAGDRVVFSGRAAGPSAPRDEAQARR